MNRETFLKTLLVSLAPISANALEIEDILGKPTADSQVPEWPFKAISLSSTQKTIWADYHNHKFNLFIRKTGREKLIAEKISDLYIGELKQLQDSKIRAVSNGTEILVEEIDFNNHPIEDSIWDGAFDGEFPTRFSKVTIFSSISFANHEFLQGLCDSGLFNFQIFSLEDSPKIEKAGVKV